MSLVSITLDALSALTPRLRRQSKRMEIGVFLFWGVGDAVLATPFLRALRQAYPAARIHALGKPWLADLFADERIFDAFDTLVPPWTKHTGKYRLFEPEWRRFFSAVGALRRTTFDLLVSLRPDPRENMLARVLSTQEYAGYARAGGRHWVTRDLQPDLAAEPETYRAQLAAQAAEGLFGGLVPAAATLTGHPGAMADALQQCGYENGPVLALSFGAAHPLRRWSGAKITESLRAMTVRPGALIVIEAGDTPAFDVPFSVPTLRWRRSLRELKDALAATDVLFCTDSGVMHMGAALGCCTVSIFGPGSLGRFAPRGTHHAVYAVQPMPCRPCHDTCLYASPLCMDRIEPKEAARLVDRALSAVSQPRIAEFLQLSAHEVDRAVR